MTIPMLHSKDIQHSLARLSDDEVSVVADVIRAMTNSASVGLILGGSTTLRQARRGRGDVDLWLIVGDPCAVKPEVRRSLCAIQSVAYVHDAGFFPWLGELTTAFFFDD